MTTSPSLRITHWIGGVLAGLLVGGSVGILLLKLEGIVMFFFCLITGGVIGMLTATAYRETSSLGWIILLVTVELSFAFLVALAFFSLKEALEIKGPFGIVASPLGVLVGGWIGKYVNSRLLLPRIGVRADDNVRPIDESL